MKLHLHDEKHFRPIEFHISISWNKFNYPCQLFNGLVGVEEVEAAARERLSRTFYGYKREREVVHKIPKFVDDVTRTYKKKRKDTNI